MKAASSTLEYTVLGICWSLGTCTTYAVMKELAASPSTYYRKRAGSIYPIVERLLKQGFLGSGPEVGSRQETLISVTETGLAHLKAWMKPPLPLSEVEHTVDLVRLRFFFLGALSSGERVQFVEAALPLLREHLRKCEAAASATVDPVEAWAAMGVVYEARARIAWLEDGLSQLSGE